MKIFWKAQTLEISESNIFCAKSAADHNAAIKSWLQLFFAEILALRCPKNTLQNAPEKPVLYAPFCKPLWANSDCDVTETHLK